MVAVDKVLSMRDADDAETLSAKRLRYDPVSLKNEVGETRVLESADVNSGIVLETLWLA